MVRTHTIVFDDEHKAKNFVLKVHRELQDIATFRDDLTVLVFDASKTGLESRLRQIARSSSASIIRLIPDDTIG